MEQFELDEIQAMIDELKETRIAKLTDSQLAGFEAKCGKKYNSEVIERFRKGKKAYTRPVNQYDFQGKLIAKYDSVADACRKLNIGLYKGVPNTAILRNGLINNRVAVGYYWRYAPHKSNIADEIKKLVDGRKTNSRRPNQQGKYLKRLDDKQITNIVRSIMKEYNTTSYAKITKMLRNKGYSCTDYRVKNIVKQLIK